ncbi:MAG: peptide deformylase [Flavobacteriales bacterium]|jgi:peptide deformylase|nr:peptide deformylase [Flavobacteriales bacterium]MBK6884117.1 peptide deformylase [Flavobacteriales bacterium]MBK7100497.1 peptide deformylase [Flavobacteriales bacterium]MBK7111193.1 peptide deformylase [Flavobacteriales bacterium]MBK7484448.1 peptide deformylase [Flavobacteriales bacterium]
MILPIRAYGDPVLKKMAQDIEPAHSGLKQLIADMFETMYAASGVGLAAPQVGKSIRLFIVDASPFAEDEDGNPTEDAHLKDFKKVFINPYIVEEEGEEWPFEEGCLSIPTIREEVKRQPKIVLQYQDEKFKEHEEEFEGFAARVIQHEHDHLDGVLFVDHLPALRKRLLAGKLRDISRGRTEAKYKMRFPLLK